jgi:hypothetical protein
VWGKGSLARSIQIPASVWNLVTGLRAAKAGGDDPVFRSRKKKAGGRLKPLAVLRMCAPPPNGGNRSAGIAALVPACACLSCA